MRSGILMGCIRHAAVRLYAADTPHIRKNKRRNKPAGNGYRHVYHRLPVAGDVAGALDALKHLILPAVVMSFAGISQAARITQVQHG